jgi:hypothetical protein
MRQPDLFISAFVDAASRDQRDTMEYPFYALTHNQKKPIRYYRDGVKVEVFPAVDHSLVSIHDWDFVQWIMSQLNAAIEAGDTTPSNWVEFSPAEFIIQTARAKSGKASGKHYIEFKAMIDRLSGTYYSTSIESDQGKTVGRKFHLINDVKFMEDEVGRPVRWRVQICDWLYNKVVYERSVLSIDERYFTIRKGIVRKIYLWARKFAGTDHATWPLRKLWEQSGSTASYRKFRENLIRALESDAAKIPEYEVWVFQTAKKEWRIMFQIREGALALRQAPRHVRRVTGQPGTTANG